MAWEDTSIADAFDEAVRREKILKKYRPYREQFLAVCEKHFVRKVRDLRRNTTLQTLIQVECPYYCKPAKECEPQLAPLEQAVVFECVAQIAFLNTPLETATREEFAAAIQLALQGILSEEN